MEPSRTLLHFTKLIQWRNCYLYSVFLLWIQVTLCNEKRHIWYNHFSVFEYKCKLKHKSHAYPIKSPRHSHWGGEHWSVRAGEGKGYRAQIWADSERLSPYCSNGSILLKRYEVLFPLGTMFTWWFIKPEMRALSS